MTTIQHKFVEFIPDVIEEGILYVSIEYCTAIHKCVCGCGNEVVTPLSPIDWRLTFDGKTVSLYPSIGNWNFDCQSHYWIKNNRIEHAEYWTDKEIRLNRNNDSKRKEDFYFAQQRDQILVEGTKEISIWKRILRILGI